jgi:hypothetical protein
VNPLTVPWFPIPDDTIGGWAVATADMPVSQVDTRRRDVVVVAHFADEATARRIAGLHNAALGEEP